MTEQTTPDVDVGEVGSGVSNHTNKAHIVSMTLYEGTLEDLQALANILPEGTQTNGSITQHTTIFGTFADMFQYGWTREPASRPAPADAVTSIPAKEGTLESLNVTRIVYGIPTRIPDPAENIDEGVRVLEDFSSVEEALASKSAYPNGSIYLIVYGNDDKFSGKAQKLYDWVDDSWQAPS